MDQTLKILIFFCICHWDGTWFKTFCILFRSQTNVWDFGHSERQSDPMPKCPDINRITDIFTTRRTWLSLTLILDMSWNLWRKISRNFASTKMPRCFCYLANCFVNLSEYYAIHKQQRKIPKRIFLKGKELTTFHDFFSLQISSHISIWSCLT